jgi:uncharacterized protein YvpB
MKHLQLTIGILGILLLTACSEPVVVITQPVDNGVSSVPHPGTGAAGISSNSSTSSESFSSQPGMAAPDQQNPGAVHIKMPFASQAPTGNWDPPYDEACEEASLIIVQHYLEATPLDAAIMDADIKTMVAYEESKGLPIDIDMKQLADVARGMFGYEANVLEGADVSIERIAAELAKGNPVIVPLAGQDIGNPYYSGDGPPYHVMVIVGYDSKNFMTHDVGTKRGGNYTYPHAVIMNAIHDWNGSVETIRSGVRRVLVVKK